MKRIVSMLMLLVLTFSMFSVALAEVAVPYASPVFNRTSISINQSSGEITALAKTSSNGVASKLGVKSLSIQVKNGLSWSTVASVSELYNYNVSSFSKTIKCNATSGKKYRAKVTFYGTVNGVSESHSMTSDPITAS